ncbi:DUF1707 domain-containing protein [Streptomyces sp. NBC_00878]|uniref:DUF1707 SHOCT-like domain-containing protein n=1 Tax=Streptomyces sp. NBC_00878 TaxID=2975854 RepID=UPI002253DEB4|nr:DUF1707 domain-containing protein [Streptomyces sp. NBC_00878]MCX4904333.1 DUF1707 domain-containing protein [Streptomyces sp. NBC_00878]
MALRPKDPNALIGEDERDRATQLLQDVYAKGELTHQELDRCLEQVLNAKTRGQLDVAVAGLQTQSSDDRATITAVKGLIYRRGRWQVPANLTVASALATVYLDLSRAVIEHPVVDLEVLAGLGRVRIIVPRDSVVDLEDMNTGMKGISYKPRRSSGSGGLRIRIHGTVGMRKLTVRHALLR